MGDIYYKNNTIIPASIHVTGPYSDLKIILFKESDTFYEVTNISLILNQMASVDQLKLDLISPKNKEKIFQNDFLIATYQGNGKYKIFINTNNMTTGYYGLWCVRQSFSPVYEKKSFYLENNTKNHRLSSS